jgi:hypothetical protein
MLPAACGQGHLDSPAHDPDTGIRHHHVQTAKLPLGRFYHPGPGFFESYVLMQKDRRAAGAADLLHHRLTARVIEVRHHYLGAFAREGRRAQAAPIPDAPPVTIATLF